MECVVWCVVVAYLVLVWTYIYIFVEGNIIYSNQFGFTYIR